MFDFGLNPKTGKRLLKARPKIFTPHLADLPQVAVPCGKCAACLRSRRNGWIARLSSEAFTSKASTFITLTYDDSHLPDGNKVCKSDVQDFMKRFRHLDRHYKALPDSFKYFIVSEYGKKFHRPHYHGLLFGVDLFEDVFKPSVATIRDDGRPCWTCEALQKAWKNGFVSIDRVTPRSIKYVSKYVVKDDGGFNLFSRKIGLSLFASDQGLTDFAINSYKNGFVVLTGYKQPVPKFVDRYLERFDPSLYQTVKDSRRQFLASLPLASMPSLRERDLLYQDWLETLTRRYDNDN